MYRYQTRVILNTIQVLLFGLFFAFLVALLAITSGINNAQKTNIQENYLKTTDFSCGIPSPCQISVKDANGNCKPPINRPVGSVCKSACVTNGTCAVRYSQANEEKPEFFCNATQPQYCVGFCDTALDCPIPAFLEGLSPVAIACIKSDDETSIGTCLYSEKYAQFYNSETNTINWFINIPRRTGVDYPDDNSICDYLIYNEDLANFNSSNPDVAFSKSCLKSQTFFFGYRYADYCLYQYECTRPDNLGHTIGFMTGGTLIVNWGIYSTNGTNILSPTTVSYTNITDFLIEFLL